MATKSKRYQKARTTIESAAEPVGLSEAVKMVQSMEAVKFDQSVDCVLQLGIDPKQADQIVRGSLSLPNGIGKSKAVVAFCDDSEVEAAKKAGALEAGCDALIEKVMGGWSGFDVAVASPKVMGKVGKLGRLLGPQGKMPSPKNGTVTADISKAVSEFAAGKIEFRNDSGGNVHAVVGKASFDSQKLVENIEAFLAYIRRIKPAAAKGIYIKKMSISATMSPGVAVQV